MRKIIHQQGYSNSEMSESILKKRGSRNLPAKRSLNIGRFNRMFIVCTVLLLLRLPVTGQITGMNNICVGASTTLSDPNSGGTWSSGNTGVASIDPVTGALTGVAGGVTTISYTYLSTSDVSAVTVDAAAPSAGTISGANAVCISSFTTLNTSGTSGGTWSTANSIASVTGLGSGNASVTGNAIGSDVISYTVSNSCGTSSSSTNITINGQVGFIYTYAGTGVSGFSGDNNPAFQAQIKNPRDIFVDASSNLFFCDPMNNRIRKVTPAGIISTVAGSAGAAGNLGDGGQATDATLSAANGIFVDAAGNMFISNTGSRKIREVNTSGIISTIAGNGSLGSTGDGGAATNATFNFPLGIIEDAAGNVYIADQGNSNVRKIDVSGNITTVAGSAAGTAGFSGDGGQATAALMSGVRGLAMDNAGNIYIADASNNRLRKYVPSTGIITTIAGTGPATLTGDGGQATAATLNAPSRFAYDGANIIYVSDQTNSAIRAINLATGIISTVAGTGTAGFSGDGGLATAAEINTPAGIAVDHFGNFYIADALNFRVRIVPSNGSISTNIAGPSTVDAGSGVTLTSFLSASGTASYQWLKNGVAIGGNSATLTDVSPSNGDVYNVIVTVTPPCGGSTFSDTSNNITVTVNPTITASAGPNGTIIPSGFQSVPSGNEAFAIVPNAGYHVADVLVDGSSVGAVTSYTFTSASPVAHTISVSYASDCTVPGISSAATATNTTCNAGSDGTVTTSVTGTATITYLWSNGATTANLSGVPAGVYTYTATNTCGSVSGSATVNQPTAVVATATITQASCHGSAASVVVTATGGAGGYTGTGTYSLADGTSSTYMVSDASSCSATSSSVTASSPSAVAATATITQALCHGSAASVSVTATGGTGAYTGTGTFSLADATSSTYTVHDANSCSATSSSVTATSPSAISVSASAGTITCHGGTTTVTVTASGGTGTLSGTGTFTGVTAGTHSYTVTDANGCSATTSVTITNPAAISLTWSSPHTEFSGVSGYTSCSNVVLFGYDVTISVTASGGVSPYTGTSLTIPSTIQSSYTVTVMDANGCTASLTACSMDVTCGTKGNPTKTSLCRNGHTICVDNNAVDAQLASGATLGPCTGGKSSNQGTIGSSETDQVNVFPNPTDGTFNVVIPADQKSAEIYVTDITGRTIDTKSITDNSGTPVEFNMDHLGGGIYLVKINAGDYSTVVKLVVR